MDTRKQRSRQIRSEIRHILLHDWDPIGVQTYPEAQDEYDAYIGGVYRLLSSGASEEEVIAHLHTIEMERMGLRMERSRLTAVARKLLELNVAL